MGEDFYGFWLWPILFLAHSIHFYLINLELFTLVYFWLRLFATRKLHENGNFSCALIYEHHTKLQFTYLWIDFLSFLSFVGFVFAH